MEVTASRLPQDGSIKNSVPQTKRKRSKKKLKPNNLYRYQHLKVYTNDDGSLQVEIDGRPIELKEVKKNLQTVVPASVIDGTNEDLQDRKTKIVEGYQYLAIHFICNALIYYNHHHNLQYGKNWDHLLLAGAHSYNHLKQLHTDINQVYKGLLDLYDEELGGIEKNKQYFQKSDAFDKTKVKRRRIQHKIQKRTNKGAYNTWIKQQWMNGDVKYTLDQMCDRLKIVQTDRSVRRVTLVMKELAKQWKNRPTQNSV